MSDWQKEGNGSTGSSNVTPFRKRKSGPSGPANASVKISPWVVFDDSPNWLESVEKLRANNGQIVEGLRHLLPPNTVAIDHVTVVERNDGSPAFFEIRCRTRTRDGIEGKAYRVVYRATVSGSDDPRNDGVKMRCDFGPLFNYGLHTPTNAPALLAAQDLFEEGRVKQVAIFWTEGEKARRALEQRLTTDYAKGKLEALGLYGVTSATLSGQSGARNTNYELMPNEDVPQEFVSPGKNDRRLDLPSHVHFIITDNDDAGREEARQIAWRMEKVFRVPRRQIHIVPPPPGCKLHWDDADPLPKGVTEQHRVDSILAAPSLEEDWVRVAKGKQTVIDTKVVRNRRRALRQAGLLDAYQDHATGYYHFICQPPLQDERHPRESEIAMIAERAMSVMGEDAKVSDIKEADWRPLFHQLADDNGIDSIWSETMQLIEKGRDQVTPDNSPEMLFIKMFDLEDNAYNRWAGWHMIRDIVATRLRPAFRQKPITPQLMYIFYGDESQGKSTAVKVLAGGSPESIKSTSRYTDSVTFKDLYATANGNLSLYQKLAGVTAVEFPDKSLGTNIGANLADTLKHFANVGTVEYRGIRSKDLLAYSLRCVKCFTTNRGDIITFDMGNRRWVIVDTSKRLRTAFSIRNLLEIEQREPTWEEQMILDGKNPGLNWVADNFAAMLAQMYDSGAWQGDLLPTAEFLELMVQTQTSYQSRQNWEIQLDFDLEPFEDRLDIGILPHAMSAWAGDQKSGIKPTPSQWRSALESRGWFKMGKWFATLKNSRDIWVRKGTKNSKEVTHYLHWMPAGPNSSTGKWELLKNPTPAQVELLTGKSEDDIPF